MAPVCKGVTKQGVPCRNQTRNVRGYCYLHSTAACGIDSGVVVSEVPNKCDSDELQKTKAEVSILNKKRQFGIIVVKELVQNLRELQLQASQMSDSIKEANEQADMVGCCKICFDADKNARFVPCNHVASCMGCASQIAYHAHESQRKCPICRSAVSKIEQVYII